jgi:hypothetical protein
VVEGPDGSIAIAFNQEVPPPEPPATRTTIHITAITFCEKGKVMTCVFFYISMFMLTWFSRFIDIVNACLMLMTFALVVLGWSIAEYQVVVHGILSIMAFVPLMVIDMWGTAVYQLGVSVLCMYLKYTSEYVTSFQLEP